MVELKGTILSSGIFCFYFNTFYINVIGDSMLFVIIKAYIDCIRTLPNYGWDQRYVNLHVYFRVQQFIYQRNNNE